MDTKKSNSNIASESVLKDNAIKTMVEGEFTPQDMLAIRGLDERYEYRWLNATKLAASGGFDPRGYEVVKTTDASEAPKFKSPYGVEATVIDGTIRRGDAVLARIPKEAAQRRREYFRFKNRQKEEIINVKNKASGMNAKVAFESRRGQNVESYD